MLKKEDVARVYDTILTAPGMNENVKLVFQTTRKNLLLLHKVIERGLNEKGEEGTAVSVLDIVSADALKELSLIATELLQKAGLADMNEKLKAF